MFLFTDIEGSTRLLRLASELVNGTALAREDAIGLALGRLP